MLSLLELVSQNQPHFQTHQALLVLGLQNDFLQPDGKIPVSTRSGFLERIQTLIPAFRQQQSANIIWIRTLYETDRLANDPTTGEGDAVVVGGLADPVESSTDDDEDLAKDLIPQAQSKSSRQRALDLLKRVSARRRTTAPGDSPSAAEEDEELFLRHSAKAGPACLPNTPGAEFVDAIKPNMEPSDTTVQTTHYSAFQGTSLLLILRARLVTELYICGCITNVSVLATVVDAARHGIRINVVGDCLGFRKQARHEIALKRMVEFFDANIVDSTEVITRKSSEEEEQRPPSPDGTTEDEQRLQNLVDKLRLAEASPPHRPTSKGIPRPAADSPAIVVNGRQRAFSNASVAETTETQLSDEQFAEKLVQGAKLAHQERRQSATKQNLVKSKIRMRPRSDKPRKEEEQKSRAESSKKSERRAEPSLRDRTEQVLENPVEPPEAVTPDRPRATFVTKAESSGELRQGSLKNDRSLKSSVSHPALSGQPELKDKSSTSRMRLALSRSPKSDSNKELPAQPLPLPQPSPTKSRAETPTAAPPDKASIGKKPKLQSLATFPTLGPNDVIGEGDSRIYHNFFPPHLIHPTDRSKPLKDLIFTQLYNEVRWQKMLHQQGEVPRLACCQGEFGADGSMPLYRHPTDQTLPLLHFSPKVQVIRRQAEKLVGHHLNHVLIQLYRSGNDYISEHSDKTLDIVKGSSIVNVSFGAQRTMRLRSKKLEKSEVDGEAAPRDTQRVAMPHNSMFVLGLKSNEKWLHGIMADKRLDSERGKSERDYSGIRISLTFRNIGTFMNAKNSVIWGQGATAKDQREARDVINDDEDETGAMVHAFSRENHSSDFDWDGCYGNGFDVLHMHAPPEDLPILFASNNHVDVAMVRVFLAESKTEYTLSESPSLEKHFELNRQVCFRDNDVNHTEIAIHVPILGYLDRYYPLDLDDRGRLCKATSYDYLIEVSTILKYWFNRQVPGYLADFVNLMEVQEERCKFGPGPFIAGRRFAIGDCVIWPALDVFISNWDGWSEERFPSLTAYYKTLWKKKKSVRILRKELPDIKKTMKGKEKEIEVDEDEEE